MKLPDNASFSFEKVKKSPAAVINDPIIFKHSLEPLMLKEEIAYIEDVLVHYESSCDSVGLESKIVMEYGSGGSTLKYSQLSQKYYSVEHDAAWYERVSEDLKNADFKEKVTYTLIQDMEEYVKACGLFNETFDLILLDGCCRLECANFCYDYLKDNGLLLIHDAAQYDKDWKLKKEFNPVLEKYSIHDSRFSLFSFKKIK